MDYTKEKILKAREERTKIIDDLIRDGDVVVLLKANIPGDNKNLLEANLLINIFYNIVVQNSYKQHFFKSDDGPFYIFVFSDENGLKIKEKTKYIEETHELGRFIDIDVYQSGFDISRKKKRKCFFCGDLAVNCIRSRKHSLQETLLYISNNVRTYFKNAFETIIYDSIKLELDLHPKFGMVSPKTNGSHEDMNYNLMIKSINVIVPVFMEMYDFCENCHNIDELFPRIRKFGLKAEELMFSVTEGVNTYKGLIFNLGLFVSSFVFLVFNPEIHLNIYDLIKFMTKDILNDFKENKKSFGYEAFHKDGILGARGEAHEGFPHVVKALKHLKTFSEISRTETLAYLISTIEDTNLLKRSKSLEQYKINKNKFKSIIPYNSEKVHELNEYSIDHKLSYGGSADLLVVTIFMKKLNSFYKL